LKSAQRSRIIKLRHRIASAVRGSAPMEALTSTGAKTLAAGIRFGRMARYCEYRAPGSKPGAIGHSASPPLITLKRYIRPKIKRFPVYFLRINLSTLFQSFKYRVNRCESIAVSVYRKTRLLQFVPHVNRRHGDTRATSEDATNLIRKPLFHLFTCGEQMREFDLVIHAAQSRKAAKGFSKLFHSVVQIIQPSFQFVSLGKHLGQFFNCRFEALFEYSVAH